MNHTNCCTAQRRTIPTGNYGGAVLYVENPNVWQWQRKFGTSHVLHYGCTRVKRIIGRRLWASNKGRGFYHPLLPHISCRMGTASTYLDLQCVRCSKFSLGKRHVLSWHTSGWLARPSFETKRLQHHRRQLWFFSYQFNHPEIGLLARERSDGMEMNSTIDDLPAFFHMWIRHEGRQASCTRSSS